VTQIGANPFSYCHKLTEITVSPDNPHFFVENGHLIDRRTKTLITGCERAPIPANGNVRKIGESAFIGCDTLTSLTIPDGVHSIEKLAFAYCDKLTSVSIPKSVHSIGEYAFCGCEALLAVMIPWTVLVIGANAFKECGKTTVFAHKDSYAWNWAKKRQMKLQEEGEDWQERLAAQYRKLGRCQHCGGKLNGFFSKTCADCGKPKDY